MMGGACDGAAFVSKLFSSQIWGTCRDCPLRVEVEGEMRCQVLDGLDTVMQCEQLIDYIRYEGIKLYGVNRPPEKKKLAAVPTLTKGGATP